MSLLRRPLLFLFLLLLIAGAVGVVVIGFIDLPAPTQRVEKAIPGERIPR